MITIKKVMAAKPCRKFRDVAALFAGRDSVEWRDVEACDELTHQDKLWVALKVEMTGHECRQFAIRCARRALAAARCPDPRAVAALAAVERHASRVELSAAYEDALDAYDQALMDDPSNREAARAVRHAVAACSLHAAWAADPVAGLGDHIFATYAIQAAHTTEQTILLRKHERPPIDACAVSDHSLADRERQRQLDDVTELLGGTAGNEPQHTEEKIDE